LGAESEVGYALLEKGTDRVAQREVCTQFNVALKGE
jgi:hypothetical protein